MRTIEYIFLIFATATYVHELLKNKINPAVIFDTRPSYSVAMISAMLATVISLHSHMAAITVLSTRILAINVTRIILNLKNKWHFTNQLILSKPCVILIFSIKSTPHDSVIHEC
jgi:hypothetical protein